jgi:hypothetical protein
MQREYDILEAARVLDNILGYPPPGTFEDIDILIRQGVDYIVSHRQEEKVPGMPSTM